MKQHITNIVSAYAPEFSNRGSVCLPANLLVSTFLPASLESLSKELFFRGDLTADPNVQRALVLKDSRLKDGMRAGLFYADTFLSPDASRLISGIVGRNVTAKDLFAQKISLGAGLPAAQTGTASTIFAELQLHPNYFGGRLFEERAGFQSFPTLMPYELYLARGDLALGVEAVNKGERSTIISIWS